MKTKILPALAGLVLTLAAMTDVHGRETLLGLGWMHSSGDLVGGWSPVGTITTSRPNTGEFHVTIDAPGEFAGAGIGDFLPQATTRIGAASDRALTAEISAVSSDSVTAVFYLSDLEDSANLSGPEPVNYSFQFALHRFPPGATSVAPASRFLFATGSITANGTLEQAAVSDGSTLEVVRVGEGDYRLTFAKAGAFAGFGLEDFYPFATSGNQSAVQDNLPVGTADSKSSDHVIITFNTADVQNASNDNPEAEDDEFHFSIYRAGTSSPATAESALLLAMASVQGNNGLLRRGLTSLPGGSLAVQRNGAGRYRVLFSAPGQFANRGMSDFVILAHLNNSSSIDRIPSVRGMTLSPDTFEFDVRINDVENAGENVGVAEDNDFFLTVHDARSVSRPDLRIGRTPSLTTMRGDDRYNTNAAGQRVRLPSKGRSGARVHFAAENDGNTTGAIRIGGRTGKGLVKTRCFRITGGKANVTAAFRAAGHLVEEMRPAETVRYLARTSFAEKSPRDRAVLRLHARPGLMTAPADAALARIVRR